MLGTIVNALLIAIGGFIGALCRRKIPRSFSETIMKALALCVMYIGISGALEGKKTLVTIISVVVGTLIGELIDIDDKVNKLGHFIESKVAKNSKSSFSVGFVSATLLFCVGAMAVLGSLQSGLSGNHETLFTKSAIDFVCAIILASTSGIGVVFSAFSVFIYQGTITLLSTVIAPYLSENVVAEMTCTGSIIIIGLSLNMLGLTKIKVMNIIPAIFLPILLCLFM